MSRRLLGGAAGNAGVGRRAAGRARRGAARLALLAAGAGAAAGAAWLLASAVGSGVAGAFAAPRGEALRPRQAPASAVGAAARPSARVGLAGRQQSRLPLRSSVARRAGSSIPVDELAPDEVEVPAAVAQGILPQLPEWADKIIGVLLIAFPVVVVLSWGTMTYVTYREAEKATEEDKKRKIKKAIQMDDDMFLPDSQKLADLEKPNKKMKRRKKTALMEAMELDEKN